MFMQMRVIMLRRGLLSRPLVKWQEIPLGLTKKVADDRRTKSKQPIMHIYADLPAA
jgi:hypothetical protein